MQRTFALSASSDVLKKISLKSESQHIAGGVWTPPRRKRYHTTLAARGRSPVREVIERDCLLSAGRTLLVTCTLYRRWTVISTCQSPRWPTWTTSRSSAPTWTWLSKCWDVSDRSHSLDGVFLARVAVTRRAVHAKVLVAAGAFLTSRAFLASPGVWGGAVALMGLRDRTPFEPWSESLLPPVWVSHWGLWTPAPPCPDSIGLIGSLRVSTSSCVLALPVLCTCTRVSESTFWFFRWCFYWACTESLNLFGEYRHCIKQYWVFWPMYTEYLSLFRKVLKTFLLEMVCSFQCTGLSYLSRFITKSFIFGHFLKFHFSF